MCLTNFSNFVWYSLTVPVWQSLVSSLVNSSKPLGPNRCKRSWRKSVHWGSSWSLMYQQNHWRASRSKWNDASGTLVTSKVLCILKYCSALCIHPLGSSPLKWGTSIFSQQKLLEAENAVLAEDSGYCWLLMDENWRWRSKNLWSRSSSLVLRLTSSSSICLFVPAQVTTIRKFFFISKMGGKTKTKRVLEKENFELGKMRVGN